MNAKIYRDLILNEYAYPFYEKITLEKGITMWQDDGARYHTAKAVQKWELEMLMERMGWPAQSPDLNPIEHVWALMKHRISKRRHRINSAEELATIMQEEWDKITPADYSNIIRSMQRRLKEVIKAKGGSTKY